MSNANFCWYCSKALVGPGGKPHKEPLYFKLVKTHDGYEVRVHASCEGPAIRYINLSKITAAPPFEEGGTNERAVQKRINNRGDG